MGRVALEVTLEGAVFLGDCQGVVLFGEVIHAEVVVAVVGEDGDDFFQHLKFFFWAGQIFGLEDFLGWHDPGDVGV